MRRLLAPMTQDREFSRWELTEFLLGAGRALRLARERGIQRPKHLCERTIRKAECLGYISRLPSAVLSRAPLPKPRRIGRRYSARVYKESAYLLTDKGADFLKSMESMELMKSRSLPSDRPPSFGSRSGGKSKSKQKERK